MANTYTCLNIHCVFSTKNREKLIDSKIMGRLWAYMGGIARQNKVVAHAIGGTEDHVHLLISMPPTLSTSKALQLIKGGSSKWLNEEFSGKPHFAWQAGYAVFSVSPSRIQNTCDYINRQAEHHKKISFEEEYLSFLKNSGIIYDEKYVLD